MSRALSVDLRDRVRLMCNQRALTGLQHTSVGP
jgi:hypothetical protein